MVKSPQEVLAGWDQLPDPGSSVVATTKEKQMTSQVENFEFSIGDKTLKVRFKPHQSDLWAGIRFSAHLGKRVSAELTRIREQPCVVSVALETNPGSGDISAVYSVQEAVPQDVMENLVHSLYLWINYPERY